MNDGSILVTGAAGWLGRGLVRALFEGIDGVADLKPLSAERKIRALLSHTDDPAVFSKYGTRVEIIQGDLRSSEDCHRFCEGQRNGIIFHTAGVIHPKRVRNFYDINVNGTQNLLRAAEASGLRRAVVVSSNSPIGCNPTIDHVFDETHPYNPYMHYGRSKMLMEEVVNATRSLGAIETVLIRAPWFYGPFQPKRQSLFFEMVRDGRAPIVGNGTNRRSMAYIDNLAQGLIRAANVDAASGQIYWIADERPYSMTEILDTIEDVMEVDFGIRVKRKRIRLPYLTAEIALCVDKLIQGSGFYHQKIHVLSEMNKTIACSIERARRELSYRPTVGLREGMHRSIKWMLQNTQFQRMF